jgi:hypothetical protein
MPLDFRPAARAFAPYSETSAEESVYKNGAFFTNDRHQPALYISMRKINRFCVPFRIADLCLSNTKVYYSST